VVVSKQGSEHYVWGENCDGWHLVKGDALSVIHERMPAGTSEVTHKHQTARQFFFVLCGVGTLDVDGVVHTIRAHEGVEVAPGVPHQMRNESSAAVEFLVISQPTTKGDRVNQTAEPSL
jgi:mannose-6-phosphate isomerase-like protein (cupin superfamily)